MSEHPGWIWVGSVFRTAPPPLAWAAQLSSRDVFEIIVGELKAWPETTLSIEGKEISILRFDEVGQRSIHFRPTIGGELAWERLKRLCDTLSY